MVDDTPAEGRPAPERTGIACALCGATAPPAGIPLTWSSAVEQGRTQWFCGVCSREHVRSIEGRLPPEWW
jgi:hypothetical protein